MSDSKDKKSSTLTLSSSKLQLGSIRGGQVPQSLSHGRVKSVKVEVRKKRRALSPEEAATIRKEREIAEQSTGSVSVANRAAIAAIEEQHSDGKLTAGEMDARLKALKQAAEDDEKAREEATRKAEEAEKEAEKSKESNTVDAVEEPEEEQATVAEEDPVQDVTAEELIAVDFPDGKNSLVKPIKSNERVQAAPVKEKKKAEKEGRASKLREDSKRRTSKLTIAQALSGQDDKVRSLASVKRAREKARRAAMGGVKEKEKILREVTIPEVITVQELANRMAERVYDVTKILMKMGMMVTANQTIDADTAELVVSEFGHNIKRVTDADVENILIEKEEEATEDVLVKRAPVVTFMGHVDHGKTSLLDVIRKAQVAEGEAGGITQHIGAYQVSTPSGEKITFLDTPGHEAFTNMRKRGATATDVVVLVVAADDGIMAQTVEAINHAKAAGVPMVIAVNKIDKPGADPKRVRNELLSYEIVSEELGGDVLVVDVSAKTGANLDKLLEAILLQAEVLELKANPNRKATGTVVESFVDKGKGVVSTILVQKGTLRLGDLIVAGTAFGRVRAMTDAAGKTVEEAGPSMPVEVLGLSDAPLAGSMVDAVDTERQAREITEYRQKRERDLRTAQEKRGSLEELFLQASEGGIKEVPVVIKADVQGSAEAIVGSLQKISTDEVGIKVLHNAVGGISESDINLASASRAIVLGFNVRADGGAKALAAKDNIDIRYYSIIYDLIDDMKLLLGGMLKPAIREKFLGTAEIREIFNMSKAGKVAGCYVTEGIIKRGAGVRLLRDNVVIHEGTLKTLKRFKDDVKEVGTNFECGMAFENYEDIKVGDLIEAFELVEEQRTL